MPRELDKQKSRSGQNRVPEVIQLLAEEIERRAVSFEGIYRIVPSASTLEYLLDVIENSAFSFKPLIT